MESKNALSALTGLAHETRLAIFRLLVTAGPAGLAPGELGARLVLAPATLSFHLKELRHAGLVGSRRDGRNLYYTADYAVMNSLLAYLTENCCQGAACTPEGATAGKPPVRPARTSRKRGSGRHART
jgi:ArsR family transcriptional regulator